MNPESFPSAFATIGCKSSGAGVGVLASGITGCATTLVAGTLPISRLLSLADGYRNRHFFYHDFWSIVVRVGTTSSSGAYKVWGGRTFGTSCSGAAIGIAEAQAALFARVGGGDWSKSAILPRSECRILHTLLVHWKWCSLMLYI